MRRITPKTFIALVALAGALVISTGAFAQMGRGMGMGKGMVNLTPEKAAQVFDLRQQFMNDTAGVRKQLWVKRAEMAQLWKAEKPDEKAIVAKLKELQAIRGQMIEKGVAFKLKMKEIAPELGRFGFGRGRGPGRGMGMGPGACFGPGGGPGMGPGPNLSAAEDLSSDLEDGGGLEMAMGPACW